MLTRTLCLLNCVQAETAHDEALRREPDTGHQDNCVVCEEVF